MSKFENAINLGGNEWQKGNHHRVYFNDVSSILPGLTLIGKKDGELDGEKLSRTNVHLVKSAQAYLDVKSGQVVVEWAGKMGAEIATRLESALA